MTKSILLAFAFACAFVQAQELPPDLASQIRFDFSSYKPAFPKNTIRGGCKVKLFNVTFISDRGEYQAGDFRKYYFREIKDAQAKFQPQLRQPLKKWLEQKGFEVVDFEDTTCTTMVALEINFGTNGGYKWSKSATGLCLPQNLVLSRGICYGNVEEIRAEPQARLTFYTMDGLVSSVPTPIKETLLLEVANIVAKCDVNPPLKGAGIFSGKTYSGIELVSHKPFIEALNKVVEVSIIKCLDKFGVGAPLSGEPLDDLVRKIKQ